MIALHGVNIILPNPALIDVVTKSPGTYRVIALQQYLCVAQSSQHTWCITVQHYTCWMCSLPHQFGIACNWLNHICWGSRPSLNRGKWDPKDQHFGPPCIMNCLPPSTQYDLRTYLSEDRLVIATNCSHKVPGFWPTTIHFKIQCLLFCFGAVTCRDIRVTVSKETRRGKTQSPQDAIPP